MADGKVVIETDLDSSGIEKGIKNTQKSLKSQAVSLAAVYKKQGMSASEAFKKAWSEIERDSKITSENMAEDWVVSSEKIKNVAQKGFDIVKKSAVIAATATATAGTAAVVTGANFEQGMSKVAAISGATGDELAALTEKAKEMGAKTKFSASESAAAFEYMAMAGWKTTDMLNGIEGVMNLAAASGEDLALVSDIVTDALTAFGLQASDSAHFADVLAKAASSSNTNVGMMGQTFKYVAPIAGSMKYSVEDTSVAIGLMANAGIKGEQAGTALRAMLTRLVKPPKDAAVAMEKLGISVVNADGTMKPLIDVIGMLREKFAGLDDSQKASYASTLAGQEAMSGLLAIVNAGEGDFDKLVQEINAADGTAQKMAETMQDNLKGALEELGGGLETLGIQVYEELETPLKEAAEKGIKAVDRLSGAFERGGFQGAVKEAGEMVEEFVGELEDMSPAAKGVITPMKNIASAGLNLGKAVLPPLAKGVKTVAENLDTFIPIAIAGYTALKGYRSVNGVVNVISGMAKAWKTASAAVDAYNVVQMACTAQGVISNATLTTGQAAIGLLTGKVSLATAAHTAWNAVMAANPITLLVTAVGALAVGLGAYVLMSDNASEATWGLTEEQKKAIDASNEAVEALNAEREAREESVQSIDREYSGYSSLVEELQGITDQNGKVKAGYEERAKVITGQLANALGVEISMTDGVIQNYEETISKIKELIVQKKAEALLSSMQDDMAQAYEKTSEAMEKYKKSAKTLEDQNRKVEEATKKVSEAQKLYDEVMKNGGDETGLYAQKLFDAQDALKAAKEGQEEASNAMSAAKDTLSSLSNEVNNYNALAEAMASGETAKIEAAMTALVTSYQTYNAEALKASNETRQQMYDQANSFIENLQLIQNGSVQVADSVYQDMARAAVNSISEFNKLPGGIAQGIQDIGPEASAAMISALAQANMSGKLDAESKKSVESFITGFSGLDEKTAETWSQAWYGALQGLKGFEELSDPATEGVDAFLESLREALQVHSPSQAVRDIFAQVWPGASEGLEQGKEDPLSKADGFITEFLGKFSGGGLTEGLSQVGASAMQFFGLGVSSQTENSRIAGESNANAAKAGAGSVNPTGVGTAFGTLLNGGISAMKAVLSGTGSTIANAARAGAGAVNPTKEGSVFGRLLSGGISGTRGTLTSSGQMIANAAKSGAGSINPNGTGQNFGRNYASGVSRTNGSSTSSGKTIANAAKRGLESVDASSAGHNFGIGFGGGISGAIGSAVSAAKSLASSALSAIKKTLKINSPSKETTELGEFAGVGLPIGLRKMIPETKKASKELSDTVLSGLDVQYQLGRMRAAMSTEKAMIGSNMTMKVVHEFMAGDLAEKLSHVKVGLQEGDILKLAKEFSRYASEDIAEAFDGMTILARERELFRLIREAVKA